MGVIQTPEHDWQAGIVMQGNETIETLRQHMAETRAFGVSRLAIFGSAPRGEARPGSDVDALVEFGEPVGLFKFGSLQRYLEGLLGCPVDLVTPDALRPEMREAILAEALYAA